MKHFDLLEKAMVNLEERIVTALMGLIVILTFLQVLSRYVFHNPLVWTDEVTRFSFIWLIMTGSAVGVYRGLHFTVSFLVKKSSAKVQFICSILTSLSIIAFLWVAFGYGIKWLGTGSGQTTPALEISVQIPYSSIPFGAVLMLFHAVAQLVRSVGGRMH